MMAIIYIYLVEYDIHVRKSIMSRVNIYNFHYYFFLHTNESYCLTAQSIIFNLAEALTLSKNEKETIKSYNNVLKCLLNQFYKGKENDY